MKQDTMYVGDDCLRVEGDRLLQAVELISPLEALIDPDNEDQTPTGKEPRSPRKNEFLEELKVYALLPLIYGYLAFEWAADKYTRIRYGMGWEDYRDG